jgi:hypothetical protein
MVATATKRVQGVSVFESIAVLTTLSLMAIFALLLRMDYKSRQEDKQKSDQA